MIFRYQSADRATRPLSPCTGSHRIVAGFVPSARSYHAPRTLGRLASKRIILAVALEDARFIASALPHRWDQILLTEYFTRDEPDIGARFA